MSCRDSDEKYNKTGGNDYRYSRRTVSAFTQTDWLMRLTTNSLTDVIVPVKIKLDAVCFLKLR